MSVEYDAVVDPAQFDHVYDASKGWPVKTKDDCAAIKAVKPTVRIGLVGNFNVGKTFVTNKLSGKALPTGGQHHTEGLSVAVRLDADVEQIAWLDTPGPNAPVVRCESFMQQSGGGSAPVDVSSMDMTAAAVHTQQNMEYQRCALREVKRLEDFHRAVAVEFADAVVLVIGQMSHEDQLDIMMLVRQIELSQTSRKQVFVVHNLKHWSMEMLTKTHGDGYSYIERVRALFVLQEHVVTSEYTVDEQNELVVPGKAPSGQVRAAELDVSKLDGCCGEVSECSVPMTHVFLLNDGTDKLYNAAVFAHLARSLSDVYPSKKVSVMGALEDTITKVQGHFAEVCPEKPPSLRFVKRGDEGWFMHSVSHTAPGTPEHLETWPQRLELPSYLTLGSDDLQYNVVKFTGRAATSRLGLGGPRLVFAGVQIVLPGMTPDDVSKIRERIRFTGKNPALRFERVEGYPTLMIDFDAMERVLPAHFLRKMWCQSQKQLMWCDTHPISMESEEQCVVHEGTRSTFDAELMRPVRVQVCTGLTNVSTLARPVMAYNDGVLSIMVATSGRV